MCICLSVSKNGNEESPRPKLKIINSEPPKPKNMKRTQSDDALSNLDSRKSGRGQKSVRALPTSGPSPIRVDQLADYIKEKKSETKDGLKQEYSVSLKHLILRTILMPSPIWIVIRVVEVKRQWGRFPL